MVRRSKLARLCMFFISALVLVLAPAAHAGPPFQTDDPEPVEFKHWEAYLFSTLFRASGSYATFGPAIEINAGALPNLQLHLVVPMAGIVPDAGLNAYGIGDIELGVKYRFVQEGKHMPQIGIFPMLEAPTGDPHLGLGNGKLWARLPLWIQKSSGPWTTYGGAGYALNNAPGQLNYPFGGWLVQRDLGKKLTLGMEVFGQGPDAVVSRSATFADAGGYYYFTKNFQLLFSTGHTFAGEARSEAYVGLYWTW
ncbi:MAG TPA: transporter [Candidatus Acidoferrales bacterium]|nr:transporter [Candidatus Acidoferrales bacterium]